MSSPFRYKKKERKRWRQQAKKQVAFVEKVQSEPSKACFITTAHEMARVSAEMATAKRRKKK
jgi:hypothetical protein